MTIKPSDLKSLEILQDLEQRKAKEIDFSFLNQAGEDNSLNTKLLKLCSNLRQSGFEVYADSLEQKFLNLKLAEKHLYNTHDEEGKDLIEFAHPDGDHKVSPASNNQGDVETVLSRQKKILDVINKKPTGKLADKILKEVLFALGEEDLKQEIVDTINKALYLSTKIGGMSNWSPAYNTAYGLFKDISQNLDINNYNSISKYIKYIETIKKELNPDFLGIQGIDNPTVISKVNTLLDSCIDKLKKQTEILTNLELSEKKQDLPEVKIFNANDVVKILSQARDFYTQVINNTEILSPLKGNDRAIRFFEELYDTLEVQASQFNNAATELSKLDLGTKLTQSELQKYLAITPLANKNFKSIEELNGAVQKGMAFVKDQFKKSNLNLVG
jgi:hypothetical protein